MIIIYGYFIFLFCYLVLNYTFNDNYRYIQYKMCVAEFNESLEAVACSNFKLVYRRTLEGFLNKRSKSF